MRLLSQMVLAAILSIAGSCSGDSNDGAVIDLSGGGGDASDQVAPVDSVDAAPFVDIDTSDIRTGETPEAVDEVCKPDCAGKVCGPDGCKGSCGECDPGQECTAAGKCETSGCVSDEDCLAVEMVCDIDAGQCVECVDSEDCPAAEFCFDHACLADVCASGKVNCDGNAVVVCQGDGGGFEVVQTCTEFQYCDAGSCHDQVCVPGEHHCDGELLIQCDALGKEETVAVDCAKEDQHCFDGQCIDGICLPEAVFCADSFNLATCNDEGSDFVVEACPEEHNCTDGVCQPWACAPGEPLCAGSVATVCDEAGKGPAPGGDDCLDLGKLCIGGICTKCIPDCFGKECGDDGCGGKCGACDDGDPCTSGTCNESTFTCAYAPVAACCNFDDQCFDADPCTDSLCVANACVSIDICCENHQECQDQDDSCTHDLCLNDFCWYKPIPGAGCCPRLDIYEGFEYGIAKGWVLSAEGQKKWVVTGQKAFSGGYSLVATKEQSGATLLLPGPTEVKLTGQTLGFRYATQEWAGIDCATAGLQILVNDTVADVICTPAPEWTEYSLSLDGWAGRQVTIRLKYVVPANQLGAQAIYIDEVKLLHPCCTEKADCDDGDFCTTDLCGDGGECAHQVLAGCCNPPLYQEDFESGDLSGWTLSEDGQKSFKTTTEDKHTGSISLVAASDQSGAKMTLPGTYAIPHSGGALKFWYKSVSWNTVTWGVDGISLFVNGVKTITVTTPAPVWALYTLDLSPWAGHTVSLSVLYQMGNQGNPGHRVYLDDLQVLQDCCTSDADCKDGDSCTTEKCGTWNGCVYTNVEGCCNPTLLEEDFDLGAVPDWSLGKDVLHMWEVSGAQALSGSYSLHAGQAGNGAVAVLPVKADIPWSGAKLSFSYRTANWLATDCAKDGVFVYVGGALAGVACDPAATWKGYSVDLAPWAGQQVAVELKYQVLSGGNPNHEVFVDDLVLARECCTAAAECDDDNSCTVDTCAGGACSNELQEGCCGPDLYAEDFDLGIAADWSLSGGGAPGKWTLASDQVQSGTWSLGVSVASGQAFATLPVTGPLPTSGASLEFAYHTLNWNVIDCATMGIRVWANGVPAGAACEASAEGWSVAKIDLSPWHGKDVVLMLQYLVGTLGNEGHAAWVDDVRIVPTCCTGGAECNDKDPCTADSCGPKGGCIHAQDEKCCAPDVFEDDFEEGVAWGWSLSTDNLKKWAVLPKPAVEGEFVLAAGKANNNAVATLPPLPVIPWEGGYLSFWYQTVSWLTVDCKSMGITVLVNGAEADRLCVPAADWTQYVVDLYPWAGEAPVIQLQYFVGDAGNGEHAASLDQFNVDFECP